jgi:hypothetical protein
MTRRTGCPGSGYSAAALTNGQPRNPGPQPISPITSNNAKIFAAAWVSPLRSRRVRDRSLWLCSSR